MEVSAQDNRAMQGTVVRGQSHAAGGGVCMCVCVNNLPIVREYRKVKNLLMHCKRSVGESEGRTTQQGEG